MLSGWTLTTWMDTVFSHLTRQSFPNPKAVNRDLHIRGFHSAWMIDPGAKKLTLTISYINREQKMTFG